MWVSFGLFNTKQGKCHIDIQNVFNYEVLREQSNILLDSSGIEQSILD